jgi:16S rRNA (guanine966-N2)-methyltransferase
MTAFAANPTIIAEIVERSEDSVRHRGDRETKAKSNGYRQFRLIFEHDLFRKPVPTFRDRALMRIVGGRLRGRPLAGPKSAAIRPTADRLRESLFNILAHAYDDPITGARVLDLFAGTGALGIEALSRGAAFALLVDDGAEARALIRENVAALGLGGVTRIFRRDATKLGPAHPVEPFSLAFLDPPYGQGLAEAALIAARDGGWLTPGALVVAEEAVKSAFAPPSGFSELERRAYDDTEFVFCRIIAC